MRRPILVAAGVIVVLLAVASPFLGVKWGSVDYRVLPPDAAAHQAAERLNTEFGPERSTANILLEDADDAAVTAYTSALEGVEGVVDVRQVETAGDTTLLRAAWEGNSQSEDSQDLVRDLRDVSNPEGTTALVGGLTADTVDLAASVKSHLPWMGLIVVSVMLLLLFLAFGSLVLPLKAVAMNFFSITASFGVVTWIFSDGHLSDLLGFESAGFLDLTNPIVMLAVLFGLSMDYEVFLLSRVREQWDKTGDNDLAVATGLQKTGRIITSAALLLGRRDRRLQPQWRRLHEDDGHRHAGRAARRCDRRPCPPGARHDEAARQVELVGSGPAGPLVGALRLPRGGRPARTPKSEEPLPVG